MTEKLDCICEWKALDDEDEPGVFEGYGSVFGEEDFMNDIVQRGAFKRTLREAKAKGRMPMMFWQHDAREPIGAWDEMKEDSRGLYVKGRLLVDDIARARQAYALMKAGALSGLSIGYRTVKSMIDDRRNIRKLLDVDLLELSIVSFPALDSARVGAVKAIKTIREFEAFLRDEGGFSHAAAKAIAMGGFKETPEPRDEDGDAAAKAIIETMRRTATILNPQT